MIKEREKIITQSYLLLIILNKISFFYDSKIQSSLFPFNNFLQFFFFHILECNKLKKKKKIKS
jgi:hypothetical protein